MQKIKPSGYLPPGLIIVAAASLLAGCVASRYSHKKTGERVQIAVQEDPAWLALNKLKYQPIPDFTADAGTEKRGLAVGQLTSLAIMGVNKLIALDKSQFTAAYKQSASELFFYNQLSEKGHFDPSGIQFKQVEVKRNVRIHKRDTTAFHAIFELDNSRPYEILNNSVFRLRIKELKLNYAKAKASDTRWYVPWSWGNKKLDDKMNMDIEIRFYTSYVTRDGILHDNVQIGKFNLNLRDMPLNPEEKNTKSWYDSLRGKPLSGYSFIVPRSCGYAIDEDRQLKEVYSQGNYRIEVDVKETGKEKYIKKLFAENSEEILKQGSNQIIKLMQSPGK
ncbi:MAG: hypothetical protein JNL57_01200 [Bacteroidetes bacterium]|nr:hypothetical protein [Bacteroidota bacterium]